MVGAIDFLEPNTQNNKIDLLISGCPCSDSHKYTPLLCNFYVLRLIVKCLLLKLKCRLVRLQGYTNITFTLSK